MDNPKVFDEIIIRKCEQILKSDIKSQEFNKQILGLESNFRSTLSPEQLTQYNKIEELIIAATTHNELTICEHCLQDHKVV